MKASSVSGRMILLASVLVVVAAATVAIVLTRATQHDLRDALEERGFAVARGIAELAATPLEVGSDAALERLLEVVWADPDVAGVEIVDARGRVVASRSQLDRGGAGSRVVAWNIDGPVDEEGYRLRIGLVRVEMSSRGLRARTRRTLTRAVVVSGVIAGAGVLAAAVLGALVTRPLARLRASSAAIAGGAYSEALDDIPERGPAEVRALSEALREAVAAVARREADLQAVNDALQRAEAAREAVNDALVHDLKGPIAKVVSVLDLLRDAVPDPEDRALVDDLRVRCRRLLASVGELLDAGRLEHGRMVLERAPCDLGEVAWRAVQGVDFLARAEGVRLDATIPEAEVPVVCDARLVERVVTNLLVNAIRHGASPVSLAVRAVDGSVEVVVDDAGAGVAAGQEAAVFERYATSGGGTGLGLSFVRQAVQAHGGEVTVQGARFTIRLPS